jgi:hypothetical protein
VTSLVGRKPNRKALTKAVLLFKAVSAGDYPVLLRVQDKQHYLISKTGVWRFTQPGAETAAAEALAAATGGITAAAGTAESSPGQEAPNQSTSAAHKGAGQGAGYNSFQALKGKLHRYGLACVEQWADIILSEQLKGCQDPAFVMYTVREQLEQQQRRQQPPQWLRLPWVFFGDRKQEQVRWGISVCMLLGIQQMPIDREGPIHCKTVLGKLYVLCTYCMQWRCLQAAHWLLLTDMGMCSSFRQNVFGEAV